MNPVCWRCKHGWCRVSYLRLVASVARDSGALERLHEAELECERLYLLRLLLERERVERRKRLG